MVDMLKNLDWAKVPDSFKPYVQRFLDLIKDEPWVFGIPVGVERTFLSEVGLERRADPCRRHGAHGAARPRGRRRIPRSAGNQPRAHPRAATDDGVSVGRSG